MATKCVDQMPNPAAQPAVPIQIARTRPMVARARRTSWTVTRLEHRQMSAAATTRRQSCCSVRQLKTRNIGPLQICFCCRQPYEKYVVLTLIMPEQCRPPMIVRVATSQSAISALLESFLAATPDRRQRNNEQQNGGRNQQAETDRPVEEDHRIAA